jgi:glycosyltransferase involved in cell wall biosynthesis
MKILIAHNRYQQRGGEDTVCESERRLLTAAGHDVRTLIVSNDSIASFRDKVLTMIRTVANPTGVANISRAIREFQPNIVHVHNFFPLLSPALYRACHSLEVPVVQTLHNYRTICANGQLLRNGKPCHLCAQGSPVWGVVHRCYRGSVLGSAAVARMIYVHRKRRTWSTDVDRFIALSEFARRLFVKTGFPQDRIDVKSNFVEDPGIPSQETPRRGVLFVGRLSPEKGVRCLIEAGAVHNVNLRIAGDGPERNALEQAAYRNVTFLGQLSREGVLKEMRSAAAVVLPSIWYEGFPMVILEAFAHETPVIASRIGGIPEFIEDGVTGFLVPPATPSVLAQRLRQTVQEPALFRKLGHAGRQAFLTRYTPQVNLGALETIYSRAITEFRTRPTNPVEN